MDLAEHLARLQALLAAERDEERARLAEARSRLSLAEREARGLAVADVEAAEESALAGRALVAYERRGRPIDGARIGVGALVTVTLRREERDDAPTGVVARRTRSRRAVLFDEPPPAWAVDGRVVLELEPSPVTWERLSAGVRRAADSKEGKRWHRVLAGEPPRFEARPRGPELPAPALNDEQRRALDRCDRALEPHAAGQGKATVGSPGPVAACTACHAEPRFA
ncbi:MAG TPA: AAA family ATPase, partial [Anaeromyxobacteraceae bacterium]|nr:AAA family ATPase [Anaeromyxobacteraceae bacterium]